ncbi:ATP-binding protein [Pedobacter sp. P351]|uniref:hybrid sensor histidine kinase/response regulator n=1 Tax=Pedobacter superstes TaxID=3133441 RepID=UPI00309B15B6
MKNIFFNTPVKGKVIIAFIIAIIAIFLAWNISKLTFRELINTVESISAPNDKLTLVNHLSRKIIHLDQLQRTMALDKKTYNEIFIKEFGELRLTLDTLEFLYEDNEQQVKHINIMKRLLLERNRLFIDYLNSREKMIDNKVLSDQIRSLDGMISSRSEKADSSQVLKTEERVSTTTIFPIEKDSKGFLGRLFGRKKELQGTEQKKVVNEELNITIDTIRLTPKDKTLMDVKQAMLNMKKKQLQQSKSFISHEAGLTLTANNLTRQMLALLQLVEEDVMQQSAANNQKARNTVNDSVYYINIILISFLFFTAILLYFILIDISRSNAYRNQLELAKSEAEYHGAAKQRFLANMSHEIRTPLQAIIGYSDLMKNGQTEPYTVDAIYHSSRHLLQIVNEVLDYSRITSGKFTLNVSTFNLTELLKEVVSVMGLSIKEKSLEFVTNLDLSDEEYVSGDSFRLKQILYNLLGNAIKFTDQGTITLNASCKHYNGNVHIMLSIQDTGAGIAELDLKRVFNEFEQGSTTKNDKIPSGSGLGLSIVKEIVEAQGGRIHVKSEVGKGTCFTLNMRFAVAKQPDITNLDREEKPSDFRGKVWVVDDDAFILQLCSTILENHSIKHVCFNNPQNALNTPLDTDVTCILLDICMPGMKGTELCKLLRKTIPADVKIFALTAQALPEERSTLLSQGFDGLLMKPFDQEEIIRLIRQENSQPEILRDLPDFNLLRKMTFGDEGQLQKIMERFVEDSESDINLLEAALKRNNRDEITLLLHRIAGRTAQIGTKNLALNFRRLELNWGSTNDILKDQMKEDIKNLQLMLVNIMEEYQLPQSIY